MTYLPEVAALYVAKGGCYFGLEGVDPWDVERDARLYDGPWPVVAHPPCERWGRYATGGPNPKARRRDVGDDGGCFAAALASVRRWGGVLEHPEASLAWPRFGLAAPPRNGGWAFDLAGGASCCVEQGFYGHTARKATWLYAVRVDYETIRWGKGAPRMRIDPGYRSSAERRAMRDTVPPTKRLSKAQRTATPIPFRDLLLSLARSVQ